MKSKIRNITVNNTEYIWTVREEMWSSLLVKIWLENRGKVPWCEAHTDKPLAISPRHIANIIENILGKEELVIRLEENNFTYKCKLEQICANLK